MKYFYAITLCTFIFSCAVREITEIPEVPVGPLSHLYNKSLYPFYHNVASGDPLENSVIIWTRIESAAAHANEEVEWEVAADEDFENIVQSGKAYTNADKDFTVKVDVQELQPGTTYYYRFIHNELLSPVGKTKTLPSENVDEVKFAVVSCSNWEWGYFNAYKHIADRKDLDAVLHLGDYIYEYGVGTYGDTTIGRFNEPPYEIITLDDYRTRYSQYRLDPDLQEIHRQHPFISIWDDHEITNNAYKYGAQNHQDHEGSYEERKKAARQVYYNWMPIRENQELYRSFQFGNMVQVIMLDERLAGRTEPPEDTVSLKNLPPHHTMLGDEQLQWFLGQLRENKEAWQLIGNQVIFSYLNYGRPDFTLNPDSWDGYPRERSEIIKIISENQIDNVVFVTGDTHAAWAFEVTTDPFLGYDSITGTGAVAVEFGTTSVNSGNADEKFPSDTVVIYEHEVLKPLNPHLKYVNMRDHGYLLVTLTEENVKAEWYVVNTVRTSESTEKLDRSATVERGKQKVEIVENK